LRLLRTDAAGDGGQRVVAKQTLRGFGNLPLRKQPDETRNIHADGTAADATRVFALQTAVGFEQGELLGEAQVDFLKIGGARSGILLRHFLAVNLQTLFGGDGGHDVNGF
jgi:hypothetical protein